VISRGNGFLFCSDYVLSKQGREYGTIWVTNSGLVVTLIVTFHDGFLQESTAV
jgi:hypothetical protein